VTGAFTAMNAVSAGVQGRLMDGYGPTRVLAPASVGSAGALVALVLLAQAPASTGLLVVVAALGGLSFPQVVTAMRGLWTQLVEPRQRESAYALLSIVFEVGVISGPLVVSVALVISSPAVALLLSAGFAAMAGLGFAAARASRQFEHARGGSTGLGALGSAGVRTLALVSSAFGVGVAAVRVGVPALAVESSAAGLSGVLLATLSFGSLVGGLLYGGRSWQLPRARRLVLLQAGLTVMLLVATAAPGMGALGALLFLTGTLLAPFVITVSSLVDDVIPHGMVTEAFAVTIMANIGGDALGTAVAGSIADQAGPRGSFLFGAAVMAMGTVAGLLLRDRLAPERS
jgi:MFS family permease